MPCVIDAEGLSKKYRIGATRPSARLSEVLTDTLLAPFRWMRRPSEAEFIWALEDVSFKIEQGEACGIIGRNGAGKSTLLKILTRITKPTRGRARIRGRVGSLLEVGTGFHADLTGRENIYLNAALLGMKRAEIARKFDEIVSFAEVEKFIDTPVKHYSSGMYVRLAFAVAAHVEPEILIVDEVLAVGDAAFQKKCLGKMGSVAKEGRTVLFVSHDMTSVTRLCSRAILLDKGRIAAEGACSKVVSEYLQRGLGTRAERAWAENQGPGNEVSRLNSVRVVHESGPASEVVDIQQAIGLSMDFEVLAAGHSLVPNFHVYNASGLCVFVAGDVDPERRRQPRAAGRYTSTVWIPGNFLAEGTYTIGAALSTMDPVRTHFYVPDAIAFQVVDRMEGDSARGDYQGNVPGVVRPIFRWTEEFHEPAQHAKK